MKKAIIAITLVMLPILLILVVIVMLFMLGSDDGNNALAGSVYDSTLMEVDPERLEELMLIRAFGVPFDIVMMITTSLSETQEEARKKPYIFPALEFMVMTEEVLEYVHHHEDGRNPDDNDNDYHAFCGYETVEINTYEYKDAIKGYIGIVSEEYPSELNAGNLHQKAQEAADERSKNSDKNQIRIITFDAIPSSGYADAIRRCGVENENDTLRILELNEGEYFQKWLEEFATASGIEFGEHETVIVGYNSVHAAIRGMTADSVSDFDGVFISPIESNWRGLVTCEFGTGYVGHTGMDLGVPVGTSIKAVASGKVILAQSNPSGYGLYIVIDHGNGYATLYAHNSRLLVSAGDRVEQGQVISLSGNSGNVYPRPTVENPAAGAHLHIEFIVDGIPRNAREFLP